ncbi:hypothetical protein [Kitasatospora sp. DSM 101779]|nr:hypothetical protein [Kitasatospora sp. DSM 101779]MCU7827005.1 hypothetical protein [Kitasatospora sp. DSM 101779]
MLFAVTALLAGAVGVLAAVAVPVVAPLPRAGRTVLDPAAGSPTPP